MLILLDTQYLTIFFNIGLIYKGSIYDESNFIITHFHNASNERQCTNSCFKYFSSQRNDMDVCGPANIVSAIVLSNDTFLSGILKAKSPRKRFSWLCMLDKYSGFIRKVLVHWFVKREIDLSLLNMESINLQVSAFNLGLMTMREGD